MLVVAQSCEIEGVIMLYWASTAIYDLKLFLNGCVTFSYLQVIFINFVSCFLFSFRICRGIFETYRLWTTLVEIIFLLWLIVCCSHYRSDDFLSRNVIGRIEIVCFISIDAFPLMAERSWWRSNLFLCIILFIYEVWLVTHIWLIVILNFRLLWIQFLESLSIFQLLKLIEFLLLLLNLFLKVIINLLWSLQTCFQRFLHTFLYVLFELHHWVLRWLCRYWWFDVCLLIVL